jgi:hypothetical protein
LTGTVISASATKSYRTSLLTQRLNVLPQQEVAEVWTPKWLSDCISELD